MDTAGVVRVAELDTDSPNKQFARRYQPTYADDFVRLMTHLPGDLRDFVFVDIGCGKGRALVLAAPYGFKRLVGVEFAPSLLHVADRNIRALGMDESRVDTVLGDATEFEFPDEPLVVYFYNPFTADVFRRVIDRARASLDRCPRAAFVVLVCPHRFADVVTESGFTPIFLEQHGPLTNGVFELT